MTDCCASPTPSQTAVQAATQTCPQCGQRARPVERLTVQALLSVSLETLRAGHYYFCGTPTCPVVYFSAGGDQQIPEEALRERVYQKAPEDPDVVVCYCFQHSPRSIRQEISATGTSTVVERITAAIQAGQCACEIRNPRGRCCLGDVRAVRRTLLNQCTD